MRSLIWIAALALAAALGPAACAQTPGRPSAAWLEPGGQAQYGFVRFTAAGAPTEIGAPVSWEWRSLSPDGDFVAYWPPGAAALRIRNLTTGADQALEQLGVHAVSDIAHAIWENGVLWLVVTKGRENAQLWAVTGAAPSAALASGQLSVVSVNPAPSGQCAYALVREGGAGGVGRGLALCCADGRAPRPIGDRQVVAGGRTVESGGRIAYFATRTDAPGYILVVFDRELEAEIVLNPDGGASQPVFAEGFERVAYSTREGVVVQDLGGDPRLLMRHIPDRRYARGYQFTPDGSGLVVELPTTRDGAEVEFRVLPVDGSEGPPSATGPAAPRAGPSTLVFSPDGARMVALTPRTVVEAPTAVHVIDLATGQARTVAHAEVLATTLSSSGKTLAFVARYAGTEESAAALVVCGAQPSDPAPVTAATLQARKVREKLQVPGLRLAFEPGGERLLATAALAGAARPAALVVDGPGAAARSISGDRVVQSARWTPSGDAILLNVVVAYDASGRPRTSLAAVSPAGGDPTLLSGAHRIIESLERSDGSLLALTEARPAYKKLVLSRAARERLDLSGEVSVNDATWSPDGESLAFRSLVAPPDFSSVYVGRPRTEPVLVSGETLMTGAPIWLPDSKRLLLFAREPGEDPDLRRGYLASSGGGAPRDLGPMKRAVLTADGGALTFAAGAPKRGVYALSLDGAAAPRLLAEDYDGVVPSPDGARALLLREQPDGLEIAVASIAGGGAVPLLGGVRLTRVAWSPDSECVAGVRAGDGAVLIARADGATASGALGASAIDLAWSPDGERLAAVLSPEEGRTETACWDAAGQELARVPWPATTRSLHWAPPALKALLAPGADELDWSPDGQAVVFLARDEDGLVTLRTLLPDRQASFPVGLGGSVAYYAWQPGGHALAAVSYEATRLDETQPSASGKTLSLIDVTEGRGVRLVEDLTPDSCAWLPDGRLCFWCVAGPSEDATGVFVVNADGRGLFRLAEAQAMVHPIVRRAARHEAVFRRAAESEAESAEAPETEEGADR